LKFSKNTILELVDAFNFTTHDQVWNIITRFDLDSVVGGGSISNKEVALKSYLIGNPDLKGPGGSALVLELIEFLFDRACGNALHPKDPQEVFPRLVHALKQDGYTVDGLKLKTLLPEVTPIAQEEDQMMHLLSTHSFTTAGGHFKEAIAAHTRGEWAACNGQLRPFVEDLLDQIANKLSEGKTLGLPSSHARREWLAAGCVPPFLDPSLNEWEVGGTAGFVQGFWKRLHPAGPHPGLSDEEDATFRLHIVIIVAGYYLRRFHERVTAR
jgi:hypothetical protein